MTDLFEIITIKQKEKKTKTNKKPDDPAVKKYLISECLKLTIYNKAFLEKQRVSQLRWLIKSYKKRHFKPDNISAHAG